MDTVRARLKQLIERYWQIPAPEAKVLLTVLGKSDCSRAQVLRYHLSLLDGPGAATPAALNRFAEIISPPVVLALLGDLQSVGALSGPQTRVIERAVLACVSAAGGWKRRA